MDLRVSQCKTNIPSMNWRNSERRIDILPLYLSWVMYIVDILIYSIRDIVKNFRLWELICNNYYYCKVSTIISKVSVTT